MIQVSFCSWMGSDSTQEAVWRMYDFEKLEKSWGIPFWSEFVGLFWIPYRLISSPNIRRGNAQAQGSTVVQREKLFWSRSHQWSPSCPLSVPQSPLCSVLWQKKFFSILILLFDLIILWWCIDWLPFPYYSSSGMATHRRHSYQQILIEADSDHQFTLIAGENNLTRLPTNTIHMM